MDSIEKSSSLSHISSQLKRISFLAENIPAGIICCKYSPSLPILNMNSGFLHLFGYTPEEILSLFQNKFLNMIVSDNKEYISETIKNPLSSNDIIEWEFQIACKNKNILCILSKGKLVILNDGTKTLCCVLVDITDLKQSQEKKHLHLETIAMKDPLTGLLNKKAIQDEIEASLVDNSDLNHAMMILDLDNFKAVNDRFGHLCGDSILTEASACIKGVLRSTDLIGRIGGDEFLVFLKSINSKKAISAKASELIALFKSLCSQEDINISCSIGIAIYSTDAVDYFSLFKKADHALYYSKSQGKNCFSFFQDIDDDSDIPLLEIARSSEPADKIFDQDLYDANTKLLQYTFQMLYQSVDVTYTVEHILDFVGSLFDVSRVVIFENSYDGTFCSNTFEWCSKEIPSVKNNLQKLSYQIDLPNYSSNFNEDGIFYCFDTATLPENLSALYSSLKIKSFLQCAIRDDGVFYGYMGFDECKHPRHWTDEQINILSIISDILSTFLIKLRLKEHLSLLESSNKVPFSPEEI